MSKEQDEEIKTIKERDFALKLSNADVERLFKKAGSVGLTASELLENFVGDLLDGTYSNGSDERMYANEWFDRCGFSMGFGNMTFIQWLISDDIVEEATEAWNNLKEAENELHEFKIEDEDDEECADNIKEDISYNQGILNDLFNDYKQQQRVTEGCTLETEMEKVIQWHKEMSQMKDNQSEN